VIGTAPRQRASSSVCHAAAPRAIAPYARAAAVLAGGHVAGRAAGAVPAARRQVARAGDLRLRRVDGHAPGLRALPCVGAPPAARARRTRVDVVPRPVRIFAMLQAWDYDVDDAREWAVLVPAWSVMLILLTYAAYLALALARTPAFDEVCTVTGACACCLLLVTASDRWFRRCPCPLSDGCDCPRCWCDAHEPGQLACAVRYSHRDRQSTSVFQAASLAGCCSGLGIAPAP
jgi:hypothetical protein